MQSDKEVSKFWKITLSPSSEQKILKQEAVCSFETLTVIYQIEGIMAQKTTCLSFMRNSNVTIYAWIVIQLTKKFQYQNHKFIMSITKACQCFLSLDSSSITFKIIISFKPTSPHQSLLFIFQAKFCIYLLFPSCTLHFPTHVILYKTIAKIIFLCVHP